MDERYVFVLDPKEFDLVGAAIKAALHAERQKTHRPKQRDWERLNARWLQLKIDADKENANRATE